MSNIIKFPKSSESNSSHSHHETSPDKQSLDNGPENDQLIVEGYQETTWDSLGQDVPFSDEPEPRPDEPEFTEPEPRPEFDDEEPEPDQIPSDFDDIAEMIIHDSTSESTSPDNQNNNNSETLDSKSPEAPLDSKLETAIAGNFLGYLETQLDQAKKPDERHELVELISIGEDYYGYVMDEENAKTSSEIFQHLEQKYDNLSKLYQREDRQSLASKYANRARLTRQKFADHYENFAVTRSGREESHPQAAEEFTSSPDALPSDLIV